MIALSLTGCLVLTGCSKQQTEKTDTAEHTQEWKTAETTPFGRYPEEVIYTLGKMTGMNNSNLPKGDTYEDNGYTRYLKKQLNIQNKDVFEAGENDNYQETVSMTIASRELPDVMVVNDMDMLQLLVDNDLIEDLTQVYEDCTSSRIKDIYNSYGSEILDNVMFDGKLMALPETNIDDGPSLCWLRKDWMDKLGLDAPETVEDVENIVHEFVQKDPGGNGKGETVGLVCDDELTGGCGYSYEYQNDIIFASFGAFPKQWIYNKDGEVVYGSVQNEAKAALGKLRQMYQQGTLDNNFLMRESSNIIELIVSGKCGSFFGPWWSPNNPLMSAMQKNPNAEWQPYLIQTDKDGQTSFASQNPNDKYVVVRKGYKHPEIVMKIVSVLFDDLRYDEEDVREMERYYQDNVDPTARPLAINVDYKDALMRCYDSLKDAIQGRKKLEDLGLLEGAYYISCSKYLDRKKDTSAQKSWEDWAAYASRMTACSVLRKGQTRQVKSLFFGETKTMKSNWWRLEELEKKVYLEIVTGQKPLSYFDEFVKEWNRQGGEKIRGEVAQELKGK
ncbi:MAG: extracellular solute-binding protein [Roseburia sp.]|nr:extracellular solute-binding protein [Roseburia sp.]